MNSVTIDHTALYCIKNYANELANLIILWRSSRDGDMPSGDKEFSELISNGVEIRPYWIGNMRLGKPMTYTRVHAVWKGTNKVISDLNGTEMPLDAIVIDATATEKAKQKKAEKVTNK